MSPPSCFHCGLPADPRGRYRLQRGADELCFCCPGCQAVASTILSSGLEQYYSLRTGATPPGEAQADYRIYDREDFAESFVSHDEQGATARLNVQGLSCAACAWLIERHLARLDGVRQASVNLARHRVTVVWDPATVRLSDIFQAIEGIGYTPSPSTPDGEELLLESEQRQAMLRLGVAGIGMMQVGMYAIALHAGALQGIDALHRDFLRLISLLIATAVVFYSARPFFQAARRSLRNRSLTMDVPVSLAIALAYGASCWATFTGSGDVYFDSVVMFTFFLLGSRFLEMRARHRNQRLSAGLNALQAPFAWRLAGPEDAPEQVPVGQLAVGDRIRIKPGETVAADGRVVAGSSSVDESAFSGEYLPVAKAVGDPVTAGSINADGLLTIEVEATAGENRLALIARLLERAQASKPRSAQLADRLASGFVASVLSCAALAAAYWLWRQPDQALWVGLSVLVVSCPCALSLATPTALTAALAALKSRGILISRSAMLEELPGATGFVFDKTGTLTSGQLSRSWFQAWSSLSEAECVARAAALERDSNHPIARAFPLATGQEPAQDVELLPGQGVRGTLAGRRHAIGSRRFISAELGREPPPPEAADELAVYLAQDGELLAAFGLTDPLRPSAAPTLAMLRQRGLSTRLLSGDSSGAVAGVAAAVGIEDYQGGLSAADKMALLKAGQARGERLVMVGDGVNDVPVLAAADLSVAVTNATELAKASADCLLLTPDLGALNTLLEVARRTRRVIRQNLGWALTYNATAIPLAACALIPPWLAALGMSASSLVVVANALRLHRLPRSRSPAAGAEATAPGAGFKATQATL